MEIRLLTSKLERTIFAKRVTEARAMHGGVFREVCRPQVNNKARLASSSLYGLFEKAEDPPDRMIAGMAMHDLETFPQSCRTPKLDHLPPRSVVECGDHWSLSDGAGVRVWYGAALQVARLQARAVLVYLAVGSSKHFGFYAAMGFVGAGGPVEYPFVETLDGHRPQVQPMILEGTSLQKLVIGVSRLNVEVLSNHRIVRFDTSLRLRPCSNGYAFPSEECPAVQPAVTSRGFSASEVAQPSAVAGP